MKPLSIFRSLKTCSALIIFGIFSLHCFGQSESEIALRLAAKTEQEKIDAKMAAEVEKTDKAADALIAETQAAVNANASLKAFDALLLKLSAVSTGRGRYAQSSKTEGLRAFLTHWQDYLYALSQGNFETAGQAIRQMTQEAAVLPIIPRSDLMAMQDKLVTQSADADKALMEPIHKHLIETVGTATIAADCEAVRMEINTAYTKSSQTFQGRNGNSAIARSLQEMKQFVTHYQDILTMLENGKPQDAQTVLRNLLNENFSLLNENSELRGLAGKRFNEIIQSPNTQHRQEEALPKPESITLDNLGDFYDALNTPSSTFLHNNLLPAVNALISAKSSIQNQQHLQALATLNHPEFFGAKAGNYSGILESLHQQLLIQIIGYRLNTKFGALPKETANNYILRLAAALNQERRWQEVYDALTFASSIDPSNISLYNEYGRFVQALNSEASGQYAYAVRSYLDSLSSTSPLMPVAEISARLNKIKAEHLPEYELGVATQAPVNPYARRARPTPPTGG